MAVVWSKDLAEKKSELAEAASKLNSARIEATRLRKLFDGGAVSDRVLHEAERAVDSDKLAVARVERTLKLWRLTEAEIAAVRGEADKSAKPKAERATDVDWARFEIRAASEGVLLEINAAVGDLVDTGTVLFKIGKSQPRR